MTDTTPKAERYTVERVSGADLSARIMDGARPIALAVEWDAETTCRILNAEHARWQSEQAAFVKAAEALAEAVEALAESELDCGCVVTWNGKTSWQCETCRMVKVVTAALTAFRATTTTKEPTNEA